ncbi:ATP-binding protein [Legionella sp.]|uniref:ATP-binding protein n=1 Tax=Legionella sp. TaxID=459 RepID=UPI003CB55C7B
MRDLEHIEYHDDMNKLLEILTLYSGKLINFSELGEKVGLNRITVKKYTALLQQLFLVEFLPAWHTNAYKRLIKTPKIHIVDTGIICAARGLTIEKIILNPEIYSSLLETFLFNELKKQSYFTDEKLKFSHFRDKDKVEVDLVIENSLDEIIGIEIKAASSINQKDFLGLKKLKEITNKQFKIGILLYDGDHTTAFGENLFAVPIAALWS